MSDEIERGIRDWIEGHDRPIPVGDAVGGGAVPSSRGRMFLPVAIAAAILLVVGVVAALVDTGASDQDIETAAPATTTTVAEAPSTTSPSTTAQTTTSAVPPTAGTALPPPTMVEVRGGGVDTPPPLQPSPCPGLRSVSSWETTGDDSTIEAAAGTSAPYAEVVTNESTETCSLEGNQCGGQEVLRNADGEPVPTPLTLGCAGYSEQVVLAPGDSYTWTHRVELKAVPGDYSVQTYRVDGTTADLPVRLVDRHPACPVDSLTFSPNGRTFSATAGRRIDTLLSTEVSGCSIRIAEIRMVIDPDGPQPRAYVDPSAYWLVAEESSVFGISSDVATAEIPQGTHPAEVVATMADGSMVSFRTDVVVR